MSKYIGIILISLALIFCWGSIAQAKELAPLNDIHKLTDGVPLLELKDGTYLIYAPALETGDIITLGSTDTTELAGYVLDNHEGWAHVTFVFNDCPGNKDEEHCEWRII